MATIRAAVVFLACLLLWGASPTVLFAEERGETVTVTGVVEVASLDDNGNTTSVFVHESDRGDILMSREGRGQELLARAGARLKITGQISRMQDSAGFDYVLRVSDYVVLEAAKAEDHDSAADAEDP